MAAWARRDGAFLKDAAGRALNLRGVNLAGSSKVPTKPDGASHHPAASVNFFDHRNVSFVNRPFPLDEADVHLQRLRTWGFRFLRFVITWEAVEHGGPGVYDTEYLDYLERVVAKCGEHGFLVYIDPHQDVWSRLCGGDGAPGWTFDILGMDPTRFAPTGAAIVHQVHGHPFPVMVWPTNYAKFACATLFTLFFGGDDFAPKCTIPDPATGAEEPVQSFLQRHYIAAMTEVAKRIGRMPHVLGIGVMNEPSNGFIMHEDLNRYTFVLQSGDCPTPLQGMALASGVPQKVAVWRPTMIGPIKTGSRLVNPERATLWQGDRTCVWRDHGVWQIVDGKAELLQPKYFCEVRQRKIDFYCDYYKPFANRFSESVSRELHDQGLIIVECIPSATFQASELSWGPGDHERIVYAPHYYDGIPMYFKRFWSILALSTQTLRPVIGTQRAAQARKDNIRSAVESAKKRFPDVPIVFGEVGVPFDIGNAAAYRTGDFSEQEAAVDATMTSLEASDCSFVWWNYTPDNTNAHGDLWNGEDFSLFCPEPRAVPDRALANAGAEYAGGRALRAAVRPYAMRIGGTTRAASFDMRTRKFVLTFDGFSDVDAPTEIFLPRLHYPAGARVEVTDGSFDLLPEEQLLRFTPSTVQSLHTITVTPASS
eukprot:TRINITY_DN70829_c0_g1_i1.p1 TRINITY_DN70829_c0_g1~~TRINITY_DN70829_c0_g1_i1.p1  ORF type:complete len:651 (-),score=98.74 TRINITY_DN70829_c0_g1_i1:6-1958(-)